MRRKRRTQSELGIRNSARGMHSWLFGWRALRGAERPSAARSGAGSAGDTDSSRRLRQSTGKPSPHPAFGHPLPGGEGRGAASLANGGEGRGAASLDNGGEGRGAALLERTRASRSVSAERRGSTIVVVLALLGALSLMGFLLYTLASQEEVNAEYFADAHKEPAATGLNPDIFFDFSLRQVIMGADNDEMHSALWGGRKSLMATMMGRDMHPFSGTGVNAIFQDPTDPTSVPVPDQDYDDQRDLDRAGTNPINLFLLDLNESAAAQGQIRDLAGSQSEDVNSNGTLDPGEDLNGNGALDTFLYPDPDVSYTYPDINNPFLAHRGFSPSGNLVIVPSYDRPQFLRNVTATAVEWNTHTDTVRRILRPHQEHIAIGADGNPAPDPLNPGENYRRFISDTYPDPSGTVASFPLFDGTLFPVLPEPQGVWNITAPPVDASDYVSASNGPRYARADADGDGVAEAPYIDLDFPMMETADGSKKFVPMFAITIYDADGLMNLNAHGNLAGLPDDFNFSTTHLDVVDFPEVFVSASNQAFTPFEVNPQWGLYALPNASDITGDLDTELRQHILFYERTDATDIDDANFVELSNMEWWWLVSGRAELEGMAPGVITGRISGRRGELNRLSTGTDSSPRVASNFPFPGEALVDDNLNADIGGAFIDSSQVLFPSSVQFLPFDQPLDIWGTGTFTYDPVAGTNDGKKRGLFPEGQQQWPVYTDYKVHGTTGWPNLAAPYGTNLMLNATATLYIDEELETVVEPELAQTLTTGIDSIFGVDQSAALQLAKSDHAKIGLSGRVLDLAPINFDVSVRSDSIREQFTTASWDLKTYAKPHYRDAVFGPDGQPGVAGTDDDMDGNIDVMPNGVPDFKELFAGGSDDPVGLQAARAWEFSANTDSASGDTNAEFPPTFEGATLTNDPFRKLLRDLLKIEAGESNRLENKPQRRLSINGVLDYVDLNDTGEYDFQDFNMNGEFDFQDVNGNGVYDEGIDNHDRDADRLIFRPLTPHPTNLANVPIPADGVFNGVTVRHPDDLKDVTDDAGTPENEVAMAQEYLARRDRQLMARDIYVLLYTFGGGDDTRDYTLHDLNHLPNGVDPHYTHEQLRQMAQFAVNVVDRLDADDTMTLFAYDKYLPDGWEFDTDPEQIGYAYDDTTEVFPIPVVDDEANKVSGVVVGVERQSLAFSEILAIAAKRVVDPMTSTGQDHPATEYDDSWHRFFTYIELENTSPREISFENESWQIVVKPNDTSASIPRGPERRLTLEADAPPIGTGTNSRFVIGTNNIKPWDPSKFERESLFRINPEHANPDMSVNPGIITIAPYDPTPQTADGDEMNLNLTQTAIPSYYRVNEGAPGNAGDGAMLDESDFDNDPPGGRLLEFTVSDSDIDGWIETPDGASDGEPISVIFELRRRVNVNRDPPSKDIADDPNHVEQSQDNRWIVVDVAEDPNDAVDGVPLHALELDPADNYQQIPDKLIDEMMNESGLRSYERHQPLLDVMVKGQLNPQGDPDLDPSNWQVHSIREPNVAATEHTLWHPHYDREFASLGELFQVPLFGPDEVVSKLSGGDPTNDPSSAKLSGDAMASGAFFRLNGFTNTLPVYPEITVPRNRWYRALQLLEVPDRTPNVLNAPWFVFDAGEIGMDPLGYHRTPGKINLNTMRHPAVMAGLLDDVDLLNVDFASLGGEQRPSGLSDTDGRDWWSEFLMSRDGLSNASELPIPDPVSGDYLPGVPGTRPFEDLNFALADDDSLEHTVLRSLPSDADTLLGRRLFDIGTSSDLAVDFTTKHRLLSKVLNNSTNRSNVFFVFVQVDFFEAAEVYTVGPDGDPGVSGVDDDGVNGVDDAGELGFAGSDDVRSVRIGAMLPADDTPGYRGFFVIDRTKALEFLEQKHLPKFDDGPDGAPSTGDEFFTFSFDQNTTRTFPYSKLILHRQRIE